MTKCFEEWKKEFLHYFGIVMYGCNDDDIVYNQAVQRYVSLLNEVSEAGTDVRYALTVMEIFTDEPDYGILEGCYRTVTDLDEELFMSVLIKSLPMLTQRTKYWSCDFFRFALYQQGFCEYLRKNTTKEEKTMIKKFVKSFVKENPDEKYLCNNLIDKL
jgi:hypothetical protein